MASVDRDRKAFEIFAALCDTPAERRDDVLTEQCGEDTELRAIVEKLLAADSSVGDGSRADAMVEDFLTHKLREIQTVEPSTVTSTVPAERGGQYRIIRVLGEGGMGTVYEAEQITPRRRVAIKAIRSGLRSPSLRRRFEFEAQVLARLEHAGIARLYEADTRSGDENVQAYLAMEFVDGLPIDEYADQNKLDTRARLQLFVRLCEPIEYAHRMGVIHRDLKPANIFVQPDGHVKVLDFGVARSVNDHSQSMATLTGQFIGTLAYMSPEQVESTADIDTRSDVYALGVLLFKLLADRLPIDVREDGLLTGSRRIREEKPPLLGSIGRQFRGDLEIIVAKALEKDRDRRYASVSELADDIERFLAGRAIYARGDSNWYLVRKALWRYRAAVTVASLFVGVLSLFAIYASIQAKRSAELASVAQLSQKEVVRQLEQKEQSLYFSSIGFAQSALENNDMERVHSLLDHCNVDLRNWEWAYLKRLCDLSDSTQDLKLKRPRYVSRTSDNSMLAFASLDHEVLLLNQNSREELLRVKLTDGYARTAISPDGKWLAYGGVVHQTVLREIATGAQRTLPVEIDPNRDPTLNAMRVMGFTRDSKFLITGGLDQMLRVWDVETGTTRLTIPLGPQLPICMLISPNGGWLALGESRGGLRIFSLESGQLLRSLDGHDSPVWSLAISPDGQWLASGDNDARIIVWELDTGRIVAQADTNDGWFTSLCFSPDSATLAIGRADATIHLLHLPEAARSGVLRGHRHAIIQMDWRPDGMLESVSLDGTLKRWSPASALQVPTVETTQPQTVGLAFTPDSRSIFAGGSDGTVRAYRLDGLENNRPPQELMQLPRHESLVLEIAIDPTHNRIATSGRDGAIHLCDANTGALLRSIEAADGPISAIDFTPDGRYVVAASRLTGTTGELWLLDAETGEKVRTYGDGIVVNEVRVDASGIFFYAACVDGKLRKYAIDSPTAIGSVAVDTTGLYDVRLSPDGSTIAVAGDTASVALIDTRTLTLIRRYVGHQGPVFGIAFHPNGRRLASCGSDRSIRIWDIDSATELVSLRGHRRLVQHIEFSRDGTTLASSSDDGTVRLWRGALPNSQEAAAAPAHASTEPTTRR